MRRVLAIVIAIVMLFSFAACGDKPVDTPDPVQDTREGYENLQLSLGAGLPSITMWGTYYLNEISDDLAAEGMVASYYTDLATEPDYDFYQWEKDGKSLEEIAVTQFSLHDGVSAVNDSNKFDVWDGAGVSAYYHYVTSADRDGKTYLVQTYFFEEAESFIAVDRWYETMAVETGIDGYVINIPAPYVETRYTDNAPEELVAAYYDRDEHLPYLFIFNDKSDASSDEFLAGLSEQYNPSSSNNLTYTGKNNASYSGGFLRFTEDVDGDQYSESTYFIDFGDEKLRVNFMTIGENSPIAMSVPVLYQSIQAK